ncbi:MAG: SDR family NAD(P)-dependent oxidoreductase [Caulobacteraceae bacterium]|nr:SDR family NAD(P)-dependent oxidoreductase [Caulobacteraceae bacterium]
MTTSSPSKPLAGRIALVTGATRGIGAAIAFGYAEAGAHVIAVGRTQGGLEALDDKIFAATGEHASLVPLDLMDGDGIDRLGLALYERYKKLDILVGAAGYLGGLTPVAHIDPKPFDRVIGINLTANYRLIRSMDPLLRLSDAGRLIFLTSSVAKTPRAFWGPYAAAKAGLEALVASYSDEMANTPVRACVVNPGGMRTQMRKVAFPGEDPMTLPAPEEIVPLMVDLARTDQDPPAGVISFRDWTGI